MLKRSRIIELTPTWATATTGLCSFAQVEMPGCACAHKLSPQWLLVIATNYSPWKVVLSNSQLITGKSRFLEKKAIFFGNKTVDQRFGANLKKCVFCKNLQQISCFFLAFLQKKRWKWLSTSVWSAQYPNAGQNIQHLKTHK